MTLQEKIEEDFQMAIYNRDSKLVGFLKVIKAELSRYPKKQVSDEDVLKKLKMMKEGAIICGNTYEVGIIEEYMPTMMTDEEIKNAVETAIKVNKCKTIKDLGKVMKILNSYGSTLDKAIASKYAKEFLTQAYCEFGHL